MFYAEMKDGSRVSAADYLVFCEKPEELYCPGCKHPVFCKKGTKKLTHFAHYSNSDCKQFSEGETAIHLLGKQRLFDWFQKQKITVQMEAWLPKLQQRPDLLIQLDDGRKIAIEYQCSPISNEKLVERTKGYLNNGYEVLWICGPDYFINQSLSQKQRLFLYSEGGASFSLLCFNSETDELLFYDDIYYNKRNQVHYNFSKKKLCRLSFKAFEEWYKGKSFRSKNRELEGTNFYLSYSKRMSLLHRKDYSHRLFLEQLYIRNHSLHELPNWLFYLPTKDLFYQTPAYIWKYYFTNWLFKKGVGEFIQISDFSEFIEHSKENPVIFYDTPFVKEKNRNQPLLIFIQELIKQGILKESGRNKWRVTKSSF